jgi:hypothetical protein
VLSLRLAAVSIMRSMSDIRPSISAFPDSIGVVPGT